MQGHVNGFSDSAVPVGHPYHISRYYLITCSKFCEGSKATGLLIPSVTKDFIHHLKQSIELLVELETKECIKQKGLFVIKFCKINFNRQR